jgi:hypothetical protein
MPVQKIRPRGRESLAEIIDRILTQAEIPLYKDMTRIIPLVLGSLCIIVAIVMVYQGITAYGAIDVKALFLKGKVSSGSAGILFAFVGLVLILAGALKRPRKIQMRTIKKSGEEITLLDIQTKVLDTFLNYAEILEEKEAQELRKKIENEKARIQKDA